MSLVNLGRGGGNLVGEWGQLLPVPGKNSEKRPYFAKEKLEFQQLEKVSFLLAQPLVNFPSFSCLSYLVVSGQWGT